jgi:hypothetical protein
MKHKEELYKRLQRLMDKKANLKLAQDDWLAENQSYNDWLQITLKIKDIKEEMHLAEILKRWDELSNDTTEAVITES